MYALLAHQPNHKFVVVRLRTKTIRLVVDKSVGPIESLASRLFRGILRYATVDPIEHGHNVHIGISRNTSVQFRKWNYVRFIRILRNLFFNVSNYTVLLDFVNFLLRNWLIFRVLLDVNDRVHRQYRTYLLRSLWFFYLLFIWLLLFEFISQPLKKWIRYDIVDGQFLFHLFGQRHT